MLKVHHQKNLSAFLFIFFLLQDTAVLAGPIWQGSYLGAYVGKAFSNDHALTNVGPITSTSYFATSTATNSVNSAGSSTKDPNSAIAGIQAGHDWVWKEMVYGVVFDYGALPINSSNNINQPYQDSSERYSTYTSLMTNWLFTLRGRLGYQFTFHAPGLAYLTGGMAMTQLKLKNNFTDTSSYAGAGSSQTTQNKIGWTAGAGIELITFNHASVSFEYLYIHIPSVTTVASISNTESGFGIPAQSLTSPFTTKAQIHANLFKLQLNYRFNEA